MADIRGRSLAAFGAVALHAVAAALLLTLALPARPERVAQDSLKLFVPAPPVPPKEQQQPAPPHRNKKAQKPDREPIAAPTPPAGSAGETRSAPSPVAPTPPASAPTLAAITPAPTPPAAPAVPSPPVQAAPQPQSDAEVRTYQRRLWSHIAQARPSGLRLNGTSLVSFQIDRKGRLLSIHLARSSGIATLDRLALRTISRAAPFPAPPDSFNDAQLSFTIPFSFH